MGLYLQVPARKSLRVTLVLTYQKILYISTHVIDIENLKLAAL